MTAKGWSRRFEEPVVLPNGRELITLNDAGSYIVKLPKKEQNSEVWQTAAQALILVAESGGQTSLARIGVMRALYPPGERVFKSSSKKTHWGKRKLARDQ